MTILHLNGQHQQKNDLSFLLDSLFCEEEEIEEIEYLEEECSDKDENFDINTRNGESPSIFPLLLWPQDLVWEEEELVSLFSKEKETCHYVDEKDIEHHLLCWRRGEAVEWMLQVKAIYNFSALTAILAINFFDRFISRVQFQEDEPWMLQLVAVTCLSLAAKVEETQVPLVVDLQVGGSKYYFEAKTIQNMELLVMSTLQWRMNPVTPLSFIDHIMRRLGLKTDLHWVFYKKCESLLLSFVSDWRFACYLPSVLATATILVIIHQVEPLNFIEYQNQLLDVLKITKEKINKCYELIKNISKTSFIAQENSHKRKFKEEEEEENPGSPNGIIEAWFSSDSSSDGGNGGSSVSSSPEAIMVMKNTVEEGNLEMPSLKRVFLDVFGSLDSPS